MPLPVKDFLELRLPIIDVRSPSEYNWGHIPGAYNLPLFDDAERAIVGTLYKQESREKAIEKGTEIAEPKVPAFLEAASRLAEQNALLVHCWRGGMRSGAMAGLFNKHGFKADTLTRGYKAYRNFVLDSFEVKIPGLIIVGGETGSGKTGILHALKEMGEQIIDLEGIAHHKGSSFGALGEKPQPSSEQFENILSGKIRELDLGKRVWFEDESKSIGRVFLPGGIWQQMKSAPILRISVPKNLRVKRLMVDYGSFSKEELGAAIIRITKRLGPQHAKKALEELEKGNLEEVASITLGYYDKAYNYNHEVREDKRIFKIDTSTEDPNVNAALILEQVNRMNFL